MGKKVSGNMKGKDKDVQVNGKTAPIEVRGQIEHITYTNEENGYTIAKMRITGGGSLITVVGTFFSVTPGEVLKVTGYWDNHPRYGRQLKTESYETILPATAKGIERYLGSGMIKGIGPVMANRLVNNFGVDTLDIIENDIERLFEVPGVGEKRVDMIRKAWQQQKDIRDVMIFLQGHGVSPTYAVKIYKHYGGESVKIVAENPYRLATDIFGIGFITADRIAGNVGIPKDSQLRAGAGILYVLHGLADEGHVFYPLKPLIAQCSKALEIHDDAVVTAIETMAAEGKLVVEDTSVYLTKYHVSETGIATRLEAVAQYPKQLKLINTEEALLWTQKTLNITFSTYQAAAVREAINSKIMVITGGPGTGKTTIINGIIRIYKKIGQRVLLAAPTGRAAKKMTEATGQEAKTIHRLLEFSPATGAFKRNETNPLEADLIVIDETSMVDTILMYHFLKAVPVKATLILVGDIDQLPSVGPGNVLKDIIDSGCIPTIRLHDIFRQSKQSMIIVNAHRINNGEMPAFKPDRNGINDFYFMTIEEPERVVERILTLCKETVPERFRYHPVNDIQIITPMHRGLVGVANLNTALQNALNPSRDELIRGGRVFRSGDKVMQTQNNYDKDIYNGDIGRITKIDRETQEITVRYDSKDVAYDYSDLDEIVLAYAISVHKSQGSEYPVVIMPLLTQHYLLLQRNLLYTGITRGKRLVILIGTRKALAIAVHNNEQQLRYTLLKNRLMEKKQQRTAGAGQ